MGRIRAKQVIDEQVWFIPNIFGKSGSRCHSRKVLLFLLSFKLGNSIPSTLSDIKVSYNCEHFFFLKTGNLILNWVPSLSYYKYIVPEKIWQNMKSKRLQQSQFPNSLVNWTGNNLEVHPRLILEKKTIFHLFFLNLEWGHIGIKLGTTNVLYQKLANIM